MNQKQTFPAQDAAVLTECLRFIGASLKALGVERTGGMLLSLAITNILLSLGAPGVPGVGLICLGVALNGIGVPIEAIALVMGIYPIVNMLNTMSNTTGDEAVSLIVGKMEDLVDTEVYNS
ncbi:MAG: dicarboxylate/amino acid:cation symporter [Clostridiales bacterium]|nr:dicarboxylate/amino acid:cation symporter [Clostridiales bacterium]